MAHAYTPGLKVTDSVTITKVRRLPIKGEVLVAEGQVVEPGTEVAKTNLPGDPESVNISNYMSLAAEDVPHYMLKQPGEPVEKGEPIARMTSFFGLFKRDFKSPITGVLEMVSSVTGQVVLRRPPVPVTILGYINGLVKEVLPEEGVVVETTGALIQGIFGVGGENYGRVRCVARTAGATVTAADIGDECSGEVLVVGRVISGEIINRAVEVGAVGLIGGGIIDTDLVEFLGYDIGVAITGQEDIPLSIIVTEGFGEMALAHRTYDLLKNLEGQMASINGATQIRAGVMRPEVIVSTGLAVETAPDAEGGSAGLVAGTQIRIIREPWFGDLAEVVDLPPELQLVESGAMVRVLRAKLADGEIITVPRANVEILEG